MSLRRRGCVGLACRCTAALVVVLAVLLAGGCGFHLRGPETVRIPQSLGLVRVSGDPYAPLTIEVRNALKGQPGVHLTEDIKAAAPTLHLYGETVESQVVSIDITGKVSDYLLNYTARFSVSAADGKELLPAQSVKLQREYTFDKLNVLAKEREDEFLRQEMRRDAVQQILRRLATIDSGG